MSTSTTARPQPRVKLLTMVIWPLGTVWSTPCRSRSWTTRSDIRSTTPLLSITWMTSPTANWFSKRMKKPAMTSLTRLWAPKETASPRMLTPAERSDVDELRQGEESGHHHDDNSPQAPEQAGDGVAPLLRGGHGGVV